MTTGIRCLVYRDRLLVRDHHTVAQESIVGELIEAVWYVGYGLQNVLESQLVLLHTPSHAGKPVILNRQATIASLGCKTEASLHIANRCNPRELVLTITTPIGRMFHSVETNSSILAVRRYACWISETSMHCHQLLFNGEALHDDHSLVESGVYGDSRLVLERGVSINLTGALHHVLALLEPSMTFGAFKELVSSKSRLAASQMLLSWIAPTTLASGAAPETLRDDQRIDSLSRHPVLDLNIESIVQASTGDSCVHMILANSESGERSTITVSADVSIGAIQAMIAEEHGLPAIRQQLVIFSDSLDSRDQPTHVE